MSNEKVIELKQPELAINNPITDIIRQRTRRLIVEALEAEIELFIDQYKELKNESGRTSVTMAFKLCQSAQKRWIQLHHPQLAAEVIRGISFVDGIQDSEACAA